MKPNERRHTPPWVLDQMQSPEYVRAQQILSKGLEQLRLPKSTEDFLLYLALLQKWNNAYNLTAIRTIEEMATYHILDSLAILSWIKGPTLLDVGTGAGLPGIPLAIARPSLKVVLLDSNGKKIRFLQEVKRLLQLPNVDIVQTRAETYRPPSGFDTVTSRAFSTMDRFMTWTAHLVSQQGCWLAMKGRYPDTEIATIAYPYRIEAYSVPGMIGERCCVIIENQS